MIPPARQAYVDAVVTNYVRLPGTPLRASRGDRHFARILQEQGVPLRVVYAAFVLAIARREVRSPTTAWKTLRVLHKLPQPKPNVSKRRQRRSYTPSRPHLRPASFWSEEWGPPHCVPPLQT